MEWGCKNINCSSGTRIDVLKQPQVYYPIYDNNACHTIKTAYRICGCENELLTPKKIYTIFIGVLISDTTLIPSETVTR
jgi:hypothetical protein